MRVLIFGKGGALAGQLEAVFGAHEVISLFHVDCDITNAEAVSAAVKYHKPSHILNAAAYNAVDEAEVDNTTAVAVNSTAVGHLATAAAEHGATLVHYSTDYVFDGTKQEGYVESDPPNPINAYGRSKLGGEKQMHAIAARNPGFQYFIIRTSRLFGPQGSGTRAKKSFVDLMLERAEKNLPVEVVDAEMSSPTFTLDLAKATHRLLQDQALAGIYHLTNTGTCTRYGFAQKIFGLRHALSSATVPTIVEVPVATGTRAPRPKFSVLLNTKAPALRAWQEALRDYLQKKMSI